MIEVGQVYRDTYGDSRRSTEGVTNKRTVRVVEKERDGRWRIEMITDNNGNPPKRTARRTSVSEKTLKQGYVLVS